MQPLTIKKQRSRDMYLAREAVSTRRQHSIQQRERQRLAAVEKEAAKQAQPDYVVASKYPRRDVIYLKEIFDRYDVDRSGSIERSELDLALSKDKARFKNVAAKKGLEERQAEQGYFTVDFVDSIFRALDANTDGSVEFGELLRLLYPHATRQEMQTMLSWVGEKPRLPFDQFELSRAQLRDLHSTFRKYDRNGDGTLSAAEFQLAMQRVGLDAAESEELFARADLDASASIDLEEFLELMRGVYYDGDSLTPAILYGPM